MSHFIDIADNRELLQRALTVAGYPCGKIDGVLGDKSAAAITKYRADHHLLPAGGIVDAALLDSLNLNQETKMDTSNNWLSALVASTAFKYLIAMIATFIADKLGLEHGSVEGILTQLVGVGVGIWGMYEASKSKVVVNGTKVKLADMAPADKATVAAIVAKHS